MTNYITWYLLVALALSIWIDNVTAFQYKILPIIGLSCIILVVISIVFF